MLSSRHITRLCMFLVIYLLLWMSRDRKMLLPYAELNTCLEINTDSLRANTQQWQKNYIRFSEEYFREAYDVYIRRIAFVIESTDTLYAYLQNIKTSIGSGNNKQFKNTLKQYPSDRIVQRLNDYLRKIDTTVSKKYIHTLERLPLHWNDELLTREPIDAPRLIAALNIFQHDLAIAEHAIVVHLCREGTPIICGRGDNFAAIAVPFNSFAFPGQKVKGITAIIAYDRNNNPNIIPNSGHIVKIENGYGTWAKSNSPLGLNTITGTISMQGEDSIITRSFSFEYFVAAKEISLNLDNTNICYVSVDNPISVSVPGFDVNTLSLKVKDANVTRTAAGKFNIFFNKVPKEKTYAFVEGTNEQGTTSIIGSLPIFVKEYPTPLAHIPGVNNGYLHLRLFKKARGLSAESQLDDFEMHYTITSYKMSLLCDKDNIYIQPVAGKGNFRNNPGIMKLLDIAGKGDRVIFEDILVKDDNGKQLELSPISIKLY